jgi:PHD/YefM family antitoxin component YafN of YafNO toxin-antitoxin module
MLLDFEHVQKNGKDYVLIPEESFREIRETIEDAEDLRLLRAARQENEGKPMLTHAEMMKELGLEE